MNIENQLNKIAKFLPPVQLEHIKRHINSYTTEINHLAAIVQEIPTIGDSEGLTEPKIYLHYFSCNADFYIYEFEK